MIHQVGMFAVVGMAATLVHFATIVALVDGLRVMGPTPATVVGSAVGITTSYLGNHALVFGASGKHLQFSIRFGVVYLLVMGLHGGLMFMCTDVMGLNYAWGFTLATMVSAALTFTANRCFVFHDADEGRADLSRADGCDAQPRITAAPSSDGRTGR